MTFIVAAGLGLAAAPKVSFAQSVCPAGHYCSAFSVGEWRYQAANLGYGASLPGWYYSAAEIEAAIPPVFVRPGNWCSMVPGARASNVYLGYGAYPQYSYGIESRRSTAIQYDITAYQDPYHWCTSRWQYWFGYEWVRDVGCPPGYSAVGGNFPYCDKLKSTWDPTLAMGSCRKGQKFLGNPCELGNGNKYEEETDYQGDGPFPLTFKRSYNSWHGEYSRRWNSAMRWALGLGWTATYFQNLQYTEFGGWATVWARRPDGRVMSFDLANGAFKPHDDINERLVKLTDSGGNPAGWRLTTEEDTRELYDVNGRLLSITSRSGVVHTLTYNASGYADSVTDSFGHQLRFAYSTDQPHRLISVTDSTNHSTQFSYDSVGNLQRVTHADATYRQYAYDGLSHLTGITDESGAVYASFGYTSYGQAATTQHAGGVDAFSFSYSQGNRAVTDPLGTARNFGFVSLHGIPIFSWMTQPASSGGGTATESVSLDVNGNVTLRNSLNGSKTAYSYDLTRNLETSRTEASGTPRARTIATQWHPTFRLPTLTTESNRTTSFVYDVSGNLLSKTVTDTNANTSRTWVYAYDAFGRVLTVDGPRTDVSDVTTYTYYDCTTGYECGRVHTVTDALGHTTTYDTYNAHGQPLKITDSNGVVTNLAYDLRQRLISRAIGAEQTTIDYWPTGLVKKVSMPDGTFLSYGYDAAHRLTQVADAAGNRMTYTLDGMGNRTAENLYDPSSMLARAHTRAFNSLDRLWKEVTASGAAGQQTLFGYDNNGNQTTISAPLARNSSSQYDELDRLKQTTDAQGGVTRYTYDVNDNLIAVTDPRGLQTTYAYDGFGNLTQQRSPDTGATTNTFDPSGSLRTVTDARGKTASFSYDALNRVTQLAYGDQTLTYSYDAGENGIGKVTGASDATHSLSWTYDALGRVTSKTQTIGSISKMLSYEYSNGLLASMTLPSGRVVAYGYANGRTASVAVDGATVLSNVVYDPFGPIKQWTWGNGGTAVRAYDTDGKIMKIDSAGLSTFGYDDAFRITAITDTAANSRSYGYDSLDRLTSSAGGAAAQAFTYDAVGNRLTPISKTYVFDAAGHVTSDGAATYAYNDAGRMISATVGSATTNYVFNALGQRIRKANALGTTHFVYDESGHLIGEYDGSGGVIQELVWLGEIPVAALRPTDAGIEVFYIHTDHLDAPRKITRSTDNAIVWRWDSDAFGTTAANENPSGLGPFTFNLRFAGQYFDQETGLHYNYFRDYDPQTGRYVESDPIGLGGGLNTYAYAESNPTTVNDPLGLDTATCTRKLKGFPFRAGPFFHKYVCVGNAKTGYTCKGLGPSDHHMFNSPGKMEDDRFVPKACSTIQPDNKCVEDCIKKTFSASPPNYSANLANGDNCQTYADGTVSACLAQCSTKSTDSKGGKK